MLDGTTEILAAAGLAEVLSAETVAQPEKTAVKMRAATRKVWSVAGCGKAKPRNDDCDRVPRMGANVVGGTRSLQSGRRTTLVQGVDPVPVKRSNAIRRSWACRTGGRKLRKRSSSRRGRCLRSIVSSRPASSSRARGAGSGREERRRACPKRLPHSRNRVPRRRSRGLRRGRDERVGRQARRRRLCRPSKRAPLYGARCKGAVLRLPREKWALRFVAAKPAAAAGEAELPRRQREVREQERRLEVRQGFRSALPQKAGRPARRRRARIR